MNLKAPTGYRDITRFFVPLALQAMAQAFSHPLVAMVASRGEGGPLNLAGLAQSGTVMFFLGIFAIYYMTTGMVYARTREGYKTFWRVCVWSGIYICLIQAILCFPPVSHLLFGRIIAISLITFPFAVALRAYSEGLAAWEKKPMAVLAGHGFYMVVVIISGFIAFVLGVPGYLIGGISLTLASLVSAYIIRVFLNWTHEKHLPVGQTTTPVAQVR